MHTGRAEPFPSQGFDLDGLLRSGDANEELLFQHSLPVEPRLSTLSVWQSSPEEASTTASSPVEEPVQEETAAPTAPSKKKKRRAEPVPIEEKKKKSAKKQKSVSFV